MNGAQFALISETVMCDRQVSSTPFLPSTTYQTHWQNSGAELERALLAAGRQPEYGSGGRHINTMFETVQVAGVQGMGFEHQFSDVWCSIGFNYVPPGNNFASGVWADEGCTFQASFFGGSNG